MRHERARSVHRLVKRNKYQSKYCDHMKHSVASSPNTKDRACRPSKQLIWLASKAAKPHIERMSRGQIWIRIERFRKRRQEYRRQLGEGTIKERVCKEFDDVICNYREVLEKKESVIYSGPLRRT